MSIKVASTVVIDDTRNFIANANIKIGTMSYTPANSVLSAQSSTAGFNQVIIQNTNAGATSSSDIIVNNNLSTDTTYYGDFGMNSSAFTGTGNINLAGAVYLTATTSDLVIGTTGANSVHFVIATGAFDTMLLSSTGVTVRSNIAYVAPNAANTINSAMLNGGTLSFSGVSGQLFSITDSMTGTIFSVNDVSGIPLITANASGVVSFVSTGGFVSYGTSPAVTAAGTVQANATAITRPISVVSTVAAGANSVVFPSAEAGMRLLILNTSATALNVYPASGAGINAGGTNVAYSLTPGGKVEYVAVSTTQWYSLNATYA
jgi:hypothetical protein